MDPMNPSPGLLAKLGSGLRHVEEAREPGNHPADQAAIEGVLADPEVKDWMAAMDGLSMLPVKRSD